MSETTIIYDSKVDEYIHYDANGNIFQRIPRSAFGRDRSHLLGGDMARRDQVQALERENIKLHRFISDLHAEKAVLQKQVDEFKPQIDAMVGEILDLQCKLLMSAARDLRDAESTDPSDGTPPALLGFVQYRGGLTEG